MAFDFDFSLCLSIDSWDAACGGQNEDVGDSFGQLTFDVIR